MHHRASLRALGSAVLFALLLSALHPQPAWADEDTPPPADPTATETAASGEPLEESGAVPPLPATGDSVTAPPSSPDVVPPATELVPLEAPVSDASSEPPLDASGGAPADLLAQVPEGTTVAVVGEAGELVPLATEEAAAILLTGDPVWCPTGVLPGGAGCSIHYGSLALLVAGPAPTANGVIWIEGGVDISAGGVTIDGNTNWSAAKAYALTLQGGWTGTGSAIDTSHPSEFHTPLSIINWNAALTLNDLLIRTAPGPNPALKVDTTGKVTVTRVKVKGNGRGAEIDNTDGSADVLVSASEFNDNAGSSIGLDVNSNGLITLTNVLASGNGGAGASLDNSTATLPKNVVVTGGTFGIYPDPLTGVDTGTGNGDNGLQISSKGVITLKDITSVGNGSDGANLDNTAGSAAGVSLAGTNTFAENGSDGLDVLSNGAITANNLVAVGSAYNGANLNNSSAASALPVTLTGSNVFKWNGSGLTITSRGAITLASVTASYSQTGPGAALGNNVGSSTSNVTLTGTNTFNDNYAGGLLAFSYGSIVLSSVTAEANGLNALSGYGAYLDNSSAATPKPVTLSGTNRFNANYSGGLMVLSRGAATLSKVTADNNQHGLGLYINNLSGGTSSPQNVTLSGANAFTNNYGGGMVIYSYGTITLANVSASWNGWGSPQGGAYITQLGAVAPKAIKLTGMNTFDGNGGAGLSVIGRGALTVSNLRASYNNDVGAFLDNSAAGSVGAVAVSGTSLFDGNTDTGLVVQSRGNITVQDFDADFNQGYGAYLVNNFGGTAGSVSVGTSRAGWCNGLANNDLSGIEVYSNGTVALSNLCAGENGDPGLGFGIFVNNSTATTPKSVTLKGVNSSSMDYSGGVHVFSRGPITAGGLSVDGAKTAEGVYFDNTASGIAAPQVVTLTGSNSFTDNYHTGLEVRSYGAITVSNLYTESNGAGSGSGYGAYLDNFRGVATLPRNVTLSGTNEFYSNAVSGLLVYSLGTITVSNLEADDNGQDGARLFNNVPGGIGGIVLSGTNRTRSSNNGVNGMEVGSYGPITVSNLRMWGNDGNGALLRNKDASAPTPVTLSGTLNSFSDNGWTGLWVESKGPVTVGNLTSESNDFWGTVLINTFSGSGAPQNVTLNGFASVSDNGRTGLDVRTYGAITVNNITALRNGVSGIPGYGVDLDNATGAVSPKPITINGTNSLTGNIESGLRALSLGAIKANNLTAISNHLTGAHLSNQFLGASGGVTLTGTSLFESNVGDGLAVYSRGAITLNNISARGNGDDGAYLDTRGIALPQKVTLTGTNTFLDNGNFVGYTGSGLVVMADGQISISNLAASGNAAGGAQLDNYTYWLAYGRRGTPGVVLTGVNTFLANYGDGLYFNSVGQVALSKVTADGNGDDGIEGRTDGDILFSCGSLTGNAGRGWYFWSPTNLTLKGVFSYFNGLADLFQGGGTPVISRSCP